MLNRIQIQYMYVVQHHIAINYFDSNTFIFHTIFRCGKLELNKNRTEKMFLQEEETRANKFNPTKFRN